MPLIALDTEADGRVIDLTCADDATWAGIWRRRTGERLRCRACTQPLTAKEMTRSGLRFFAHARVVPECPSNGEGPRHLHLKSVFASAFRRVGWTAELEAAGEGWRADVLVSDGTRRVAVEVQLASISRDQVLERMARHAASGVETLWVVERRLPWTHRLPTVTVDATDRVVDSVLYLPPRKGGPAVAPSASINRFVERWTQGRLQPVTDPEEVLHRHVWAHGAIASDLFQLDGCVDRFMPQYVRAHTSEKERYEQYQARRDEEYRKRALAEQARQRYEEPMLESLVACKEWIARQSKWHVFFGDGRWKYPATAVQSTRWDPQVGIAVYVGVLRAQWVLAVAEPRQRSERMDSRVAAWTAGTHPLTVVTGFPTVLTPETKVDLDALDLREVSLRKRRRW